MSNSVDRKIKNDYMACHECDCLNRIPVLDKPGAVSCSRCGATLFRNNPPCVERSLVLAITALILFFFSISYPLLTFKLQGQEQQATIFTGVSTLHHQGFWQLAILVFLCSIAVPLVRILLALYLFASLHYGYRPAGFSWLMPIYLRLAPWAMMEVYLLGIIVAYVKLIDLATIVVGISAYAFIGMILTTSWAAASIDARRLWQFAGGNAGQSDDEAALVHAVPKPASSGRHVSCHNCMLTLGHDGAAIHDRSCTRCGAALHHRKRNSVARSWAFLIAALICYIPANALPIMTVVSFGEGAPDTITSGIKQLIAAKMYPVAALVFIASIIVPVLKIGILGYLLVSIQIGSKWRPRERTILYRMTEAVGRWSMLDIFMISILAGLVQLGALATIEPNLGAVFFAAVVILTMIAAITFDPRLIWDMAGNGGGHERR